VEADELTYPMHVILRTEIEQDIFNGKLDVKDVNRVWNEKMQSMLGVTVSDDAQGCLQDVHWAAFAVGSVWVHWKYECAAKIIVAKNYPLFKIWFIDCLHMRMDS
jgi:carboxypeptidase Taq